MSFDFNTSNKGESRLDKKYDPKGVWQKHRITWNGYTFIHFT